MASATDKSGKQFFGEGFDPFQMPRKHALQHHKVGNLEIEDWQS